MSRPTSFLIAGGTGRQGGAVVTALLTDAVSPVASENIYVLTRNPEGAAALKLAARGVNVVQGELCKPKPIFQHLQKRGIQMSETAAFMAQAHGSTELTDAHAFIDAAAEAELCLFVYSSVDRGGKELSDRDASSCKTFADKFHIEKHFVVVSSPSGRNHMDYTILRPTWHADNALWGFPGRLCMTGWRENMRGKKMQVTTAKDIGRWATEALLRPDNSGLRNTAISIASDCLSFDEADEIFRQETGRPIGVTYGWLARLLIWLVTDLRTMFAFIYERDYGANLEELAKTVKPTTFRQWVRESVKDRDRELSSYQAESK